MSGSILLVVSWLLLAIFVVAFVLRTLRIAKLPVHLRWELAPVPHEKGKSHYGGSYLEEFEWWTKPREKDKLSEASFMFQEIVFLKSVWENNRRLWWFSFPFHMGMYVLIAAGALLLLGGALELAGLQTAGLGDWRSAITVLAGAGFGLGGIGALGLLVSRFADRRLREFTTPAALFNLMLLLAVFATGAYAVAVSQDFAVRVSSFGGALLTADASVELPGFLAVHLLLALAFLAYLPFTRMMHFVAKYFTYHEVRWDDEPLTAGGRLEREAVRLLDQPITWAGPHVKADGEKNWVDVATEEMKS
ncbi:MAG: respiratory nitrate reductase subunit gamma [Gemmatimonadota bacterium]|nr:MAG: respiratory nitrate reductase subunit gamma [Gemmatimonadota bacterium]